jgi:hypothetical protein
MREVRSSDDLAASRIERNVAEHVRLRRRAARRTATRTFFCGDLFTQGGAGATPLTESDILGPSEAFRRQMAPTATGIRR